VNAAHVAANFRGIWIQEEKELLQEVAGMGELREPWHTKQVELLDRHLHLLHLYSQAKENLAAYKGKQDINFTKHSRYEEKKILIFDELDFRKLL